MNIQACCDHLSPGVMNKNQAIHEVDIASMIEKIPLGFCVLADAAYSATECLVPMYYCSDKLKPNYDNFNFFGSQLCIRIEMAFGMLTRKWGLYWRPLLVGLDKIKYVVEVVARLHNFCINERILEGGGDNPTINLVVEANILGRESFQEWLRPWAEYEALAKDLPGTSANCTNMTNG
jgi:DDE superfamily endonuclease